MTYPTKAHPVRRELAAGTCFGAGILLFLVGALSILQGISAVADDNLFIVGVDYVYELTTTTWGWIHIALGVLLALCAAGLLAGRTWGREAAVTLAALSILANFLWLPYETAWAVLIIALDVVVIWAVTTWRPAAN
ncbi:DUF7144 family membrane protein [Nocardia sp.]|uniref:DUF7144 family membrane protein n=1 Tax=Nocardia sp. TaxID=1821 RepID=UPI002610ECA1|nr:hypothetical protein [Nocardia sp.]